MKKCEVCIPLIDNIIRDSRHQDRSSMLVKIKEDQAQRETLMKNDDKCGEFCVAQEIIDYLADKA